MFARLPNSHMLLNTIHTFIQCRYVAYFLWNKQFRNSSQKRKTWEISQDVHSSPIVLFRYSLNIILHWPSRFLFLRILICSYFTSQFRNPKTFDVSPPWHGETKITVTHFKMAAFEYLRQHTNIALQIILKVVWQLNFTKDIT